MKEAKLKEAKLIEEMSKIFSYEGACKKIPDFNYFITDTANVCAFYTKTPEIKLLLAGFIGENVEDIETKKFEFDGQHELGSKFSTNYLKMIFNCLDFLGESVKIYCKKDYILKVEGDSMGFLLAPRIENDE